MTETPGDALSLLLLLLRAAVLEEGEGEAKRTDAADDEISGGLEGAIPVSSFLIEDAERGGWSESASSRSSAIGVADTGSLPTDGFSNSVEPREFMLTSGGGFSEIRRRGAAGKLARLLLTGPDGVFPAVATARRSGRAAKH